MIENIILSVSRVLATPVFAQNSPPPQIEELFVPLENIFNMLVPFGAIIAIAMIIYGGYMWIISGGDPSRKQIAQGTLTWAVIGLIFLFLTRAILIFILDFFGA